MKFFFESVSIVGFSSRLINNNLQSYAINRMRLLLICMEEYSKHYIIECNYFFGNLEKGVASDGNSLCFVSVVSLGLTQCNQHHRPAFGLFVQKRFDCIGDIFFAKFPIVIDGMHHVLAYFREQCFCFFA